MGRDVCYAVEVEGRNIIITQQWPDRQIYIKMSRASAHWVAQQLWNIFEQKRQYAELPEKMKIAEVSRVKKMADYLFGGKDETKH